MRVEEEELIDVIYVVSHNVRTSKTQLPLRDAVTKHEI